MNKTEAANFLNIGVRSLERHTSDGRIAAHKVKGKTGPALDYEAEELARFKAELEAPPPVPQAPPQNALARLPGAHRGTSTGMRPASGLKAISGPFVTGMDKAGAAQFAAVLDAIEAQRKPRAALSEKLLLTLAEAQELTGLSRQVLRGAMDAGQLPARRMGRSWRIKKAELEGYVKKL
jgi:excisionase family DNA binding protein